MGDIKGGYYLKARCIQDAEISTAPPYVREIWDWLLKEANWQDNHVCKRGQCVRSYKHIQEGLHWMVGWRKMKYSKSQCENSMKWLKKADMIATTKTTRGFIITILNYNKYQNPENYESHNENSTRATREPQSCHTINKNIKNVKNVKNVKNQEFIYSRILEYLNAKTDRNFKVTDKVRALIKARFNEGFIEDDFYVVINNKIEDWLSDQKYCKFLRPETLFGTKFDGYRNQVMVKMKKYSDTTAHNMAVIETMEQEENEREKNFRINLMGIAEVFDKKLSEVLIKFYWEAMRQFPEDEIVRAFNMALRTCKFFPKPAELIDFVGGKPEEQAEVQFKLIKDAIEAVGSYNSIEFEDKVTQAVIEREGGWIKLCEITWDDLKWFGKSFLKTYVAYRNQGIKSEGHLLGRLEMANKGNPQAEEMKCFCLPEPKIIGRGRKEIGND